MKGAKIHDIDVCFGSYGDFYGSRYTIKIERVYIFLLTLIILNFVKINFIFSYSRIFKHAISLPSLSWPHL